MLRLFLLRMLGLGISVEGEEEPIMSYTEECDQYLSISAISARSDPLVWWQQNENRFPHIAKMARQQLVLES